MYATATVPGDLAPWVQAIWYSEGRLDAARERVLPAAAADIVANLGAPIRLIEGEGPAAIRGTTTSGLLTRPLVLHHPEVHRVIGLQLHPLRHFIGFRFAHAPPHLVEPRQHPDQVLHVVADLMRDHISLGEITGCTELTRQLVEESGVEINLAVARAIERA